METISAYTLAGYEVIDRLAILHVNIDRPFIQYYKLYFDMSGLFVFKHIPMSICALYTNKPLQCSYICTVCNMFMRCVTLYKNPHQYICKTCQTCIKNILYVNIRPVLFITRYLCEANILLNDCREYIKRNILCNIEF